MNIVFITHGGLPMPAVKGGAVENLIEIFLNENELKNIHNITVYSKYDKDAKLKSSEYKNTQFKYINMDGKVNYLRKASRHIINRISKKYRGNLFIKKICKDISKSNESIDMVIVENKYEYVEILRKIYKGKIVLHLHNEIFEKSKKTQLILDKYDSIFCVSKYIAKKVEELIENKNKINVLYNGIDIEKFQDSNYLNSIKLREKMGFKDNDIVIEYSGRLNKNKGIKELLTAFCNIDDIENLKLLIVGSCIYGTTMQDKFLEELKEIAEKKKSKIVFTGYIDYDRMSEVYRCSDFGIVPSRWNEPAGLVVVEAMASGLPLIVTNSGGIPELVTNECAVILENDENLVNELEKNIRKLSRNYELRKKMSRKAKERSVLFSKERYFNEFKNLIERM